MGEIIALLESITEESVREVRWSNLPLSAIIEQIYLVLPRQGGDLLLPLDLKRLNGEQPDLAKLLDGWQKINEVEFYNWARWVKDHTDWTKLTDATTPTQQDLFYAEGCELHSHWLYAERDTDYFDASPKIAIRVNPRHSPMFFHLFAQQTQEGAILEGLFKNLESWPQWLRKTQVNYPAGLDTQRRLVVEFRTVRQEYDDAYKSLVKEREPLQHLLSLYEKRATYLRQFHTQYIHEIEAVQRPLPFFIEYPFHRWAIADPKDRMERVLRAKHLLTITVKALALLPLEECLAHAECPDTIKTMPQEMGKRPLSDGGWIEFAAALRRAAHDAAMELPVFGRLLAQGAEMEPRLKEVVAARNRFNHPPYDADGLIMAAEKHFPELILLLRQSLGTCRVVVPLSLRTNDGKRFVRGSILSGRDTELAVREIEVAAPLERFSSGSIVAADSNFRNIVPLQRFFTNRNFKADTFDIGIFDRVEGESTQFEFVRGIGNIPQLDK